MHKTRSKANGDNELYTPHSCRPRAFSQSATYFLYLLTYSPGAKGLKWRFFDHESEQAEFGLKL